MLQYPKRLYLHGEVIPGDLHATNSVIVPDAAGEAAARAIGYAVAFERIAKANGGDGGSDQSTAELVEPHQGGVASASADPIASDVDDIEALRNRLTELGGTVDRRWKESRLREEIAKVRA